MVTALILGTRLPASYGQTKETPIFHMPEVARPQFAHDSFDIRTYGARSDGFTVNTSAIQQAIDACSTHGGGVVLVPAGYWLTGPLVIKSGVNLHLKAGALLQFSRDRSLYPLVKSQYEGVEAYRCQSPLTAEHQHDIAITGHGVIDGGGDVWRMVKQDKLTPDEWKRQVASGGLVEGDTWYPSEQSRRGSRTPDAGVIKPGMSIHDVEAIKDFLRPNLLSFFYCHDVLLQGVIFENSPAWCLHPYVCDNLTVDRVTVHNAYYAQNGDGIDLESSRNVLIQNSVFSTGDDGICIKSGKDEEGRKRGIPTQDVLVRRCVVYHSHGGFVIGSEMSGGVRNIRVTDCTFIGSDNGLRFKTKRGRGGVVENIFVDHINMEHILGDGILFDMYYGGGNMAGSAKDPGNIPPVTIATPQFRNFYIKDISCQGARRAIFIRGLPEMNVSNIWMKHLNMRADQGVVSTEANGIHIQDLTLETATGKVGLDLANSKHFEVDGMHYLGHASTVVQVSGSTSAGIHIRHLNAPRATAQLKLKDGATAASVTIQP